MKFDFYSGELSVLSASEVVALLEHWLRANGLEERIAVFRAEKITLADLPHLTDSDLRELGLQLGERRRFARAVAEQWGGKEPLEPITQPTSERVRRLVQAERRPLTVMFVDIVNSTGLGELLGDEELLETLGEFRRLCGAAIGRTGGHVAKFMGDGILAYFCYPAAHENDPHRAVRAGLEIAATVGTIRPRPQWPLGVRIGIATGSVILSDLFDSDGPELFSATGSVLNLAARLQTAAPPGGVVIGDTTHGRVAHLFATEDLGLQVLKGLQDPVRCWRVLGDAVVAERGEQAGPQAGPRLPLRGRTIESGVLDGLWQDAQAGRGRIALIRGEAGVGKSSLVESFLIRNGLPAHAIATVAGSDLDRDTPFFPVTQYLRTYAARNGAARARRLREAVRAGDEAAELIAKLAGLPFDPARLTHLTAAQQRDRTLDAAADVLLSAAADGPICLVVEDGHWLDPSTAELLCRLLARLGTVRLLILVTARPDFEPPWAADSPVVELALERLGKAEVQAMASDLLGTADMPAALLARIVERTDGVPLFVQAVVQQIRRDFAATGTTGWDEGHDHDVPSSLQEALMGRLDQAGLSKDLAQAASVIGRRVDRDVLQAVADLPPTALDAALRALVSGGVLIEEGTAASYVFSHALVRDIAYSSLLKDARRWLHGRVADALVKLSPTMADDEPAVLALHLTEAGRFEAAARCWLEAGRRAVGVSALTEATRLLRRGLQAVEAVATTPDLARLELELLGLLGPALMALSGPGAAETRQHYDRSYELCQRLEEEPAHFPLYWGWWRVSEDFHTMRSRSDWMLRRARSQSDRGALLQAHHCNWASHYNLGQLDRCCEHIEAGLALYGEEDWRHHAPLYGNHDARACALGELAFVHWLQGKPGGGHPHHLSSLGWARQLRHLGSLVHSMDFALAYHAMRRSPDEVLNVANELMTATVEHGFADHEAKALIYRGWAVALQHDANDGLRLLREGFGKQKDIGTSEDFPIYVCLLAEALMAAKQPDRALAELQAARTQFDASGLRIWLPEVLRLTAAAMAASDSGLPVLPVLAEAAGIANDQGVATLGLRIAKDRAGLLAEMGDLTSAQTILSDALAALTEQDGSEVEHAATLLARLQSRLGVKQAC